MYLVTGASGNVGGEVLTALARAGQPVRALTSTGTLAAVPAGVEVVAGDLNDAATLAAPLRGVDGLFLLPGFSAAPAILAQARASGVRRVVLLSGASAGSGSTSNAITAYMARSEDEVRASGLAWTILRPAAFMSNALRWKDQLATGDVLRLPFASVRTASTDPRDIGEIAALALTQAGHDGQIHWPTGPQSLLPAEQVAVLAAQLNRGLRVEPQPDDEARAEMLKTTPAAYVDAFFDFYVAGSLDESQIRSTVPDLLGRPARRFDEWVRDHSSLFA